MEDGFIFINRAVGSIVSGGKPGDEDRLDQSGGRKTLPYDEI